MTKRPGPTHDFPRGKALPNDEGALNVGLATTIGLNGEPLVVMKFGKEVGWIALEADRIDGFCEALQKSKNNALELTKKQATEG